MKIKLPVLLLFTCNALFAAGQTSATVATATDSTKTLPAVTGKTFGGAGQYSTWSLGANVGVTSPFLAIGGSNASSDWKSRLGYGLSLRDRVAHSFSLQLDFHGGSVQGDNTSAADGLKYGSQSFSTGFYSGSLSG